MKHPTLLAELKEYTKGNAKKKDILQQPTLPQIFSSTDSESVSYFFSNRQIDLIDIICNDMFLFHVVDRSKVIKFYY